MQLSGYRLISCNSSSKHTGGVCAFINKQLKCTNVTAINDNIAWYISFELIINKIQTIFACIYLSASENKRIVMESFVKWYNDICCDKPIFICGDFNIDMISNSTFSRQLKNFYEDNGLRLFIESPTRIMGNSATLIDLCLSNINKNKIECRIIQDEQISDHTIIETTIFVKSSTYNMKKRKINVWHNYDKNIFCQSIEKWSHTWDNVKGNSINDKIHWLIENISASTCQFKHTKVLKSNLDFFDNELDQMRREKNRLYKIAQFSTLEIDATIKWHEYRQFKNKYKLMIQQKKYECNQRKLNRVHGDMKGTWRVLNSILNKQNDEILCVKSGNITYEDDAAITNEFNKFFVNSITTLNSSIPKVDYENNIEFKSNASFEFRGVSISEVKHCIRELNNCTDEFFMNAEVMLDAIFVIGQQIVEIINDSFATGIFPETLKKSTITPIPKINGTIMIDEFRPINMLPCIEKVIEKMAYSQLISYVNKNNILKENQSGFRSQHSCETAINDILYEWKESQNSSKIIIAVFLDFQRAFETIDTGILIQKLKKYGITGTTLNWFDNYLKNRKQVVKLGETISDIITNNLGVPQGSILGPLLFILYINDLSNCLINSTMKMFADDTLVYVTANNIEEAILNINQDLSILFDKICQNKLKLNVKKTKVIIISNKSYNTDNVNIYIDGKKLEIVEEIKYLGIIVDKNLKFDKNIDYICKKVGRKVNVISRLRNELNFQQKLTLYKSIVQPHLIYCSTIIFLSSQSDIERLQILQNKCLRNIMRVDRFTSSSILLDTLNLMSVKQTIIFYTILFIHKMVHNYAPKYLTKRIRFRSENQKNRPLRNTNQIELTKANKSSSQNSLFYKGIKLYNSIPNDIKDIKSEHKFIEKLKTYVKENY